MLNTLNNLFSQEKFHEFKQVKTETEALIKEYNLFNGKDTLNEDTQEKINKKFRKISKTLVEQFHNKIDKDEDQVYQIVDLQAFMEMAVKLAQVNRPPGLNETVLQLFSNLMNHKFMMLVLYHNSIFKYFGTLLLVFWDYLATAKKLQFHDITNHLIFLTKQLKFSKCSQMIILRDMLRTFSKQKQSDLEDIKKKTKKDKDSYLTNFLKEIQDIILKPAKSEESDFFFPLYLIKLVQEKLGLESKMKDNQRLLTGCLNNIIYQQLKESILHFRKDNKILSLMCEDLCKLFQALPFNLMGSEHEDELKKLQDNDQFRSQEGKLPEIKESQILNIFQQVKMIKLLDSILIRMEQFSQDDMCFEVYEYLDKLFGMEENRSHAFKTQENENACNRIIIMIKQIMITVNNTKSKYIHHVLFRILQSSMGNLNFFINQKNHQLNTNSDDGYQSVSMSMSLNMANGFNSEKFIYQQNLHKLFDMNSLKQSYAYVLVNKFKNIEVMKFIHLFLQLENEMIIQDLIFNQMCCPQMQYYAEEFQLRNKFKSKQLMWSDILSTYQFLNLEDKNTIEYISNIIIGSRNLINCKLTSYLNQTQNELKSQFKSRDEDFEKNQENEDQSQIEGRDTFYKTRVKFGLTIDYILWRFSQYWQNPWELNVQLLDSILHIASCFSKYEFLIQENQVFQDSEDRTNECESKLEEVRRQFQNFWFNTSKDKGFMIDSIIQNLDETQEMFENQTEDELVNLMKQARWIFYKNNGTKDKLTKMTHDDMEQGQERGRNRITVKNNIGAKTYDMKDNNHKGNLTERIPLDPLNVSAHHPGHKQSPAVLTKDKCKIMNLINLQEFVQQYQMMLESVNFMKNY